MGFLAALPAISAGVGAAGSIISPIMQGIFNRQSRNYQLQDRDYQNWYNSPQQQMARLKEAGLNPNLVYGSGNSIQPSAAVSSQSRESPKASFDDLQRGLYQWQDYALKEARINQLEKMTKLAVENTLLARQKTESLALNYSRDASLFQNSLSMAEERLRAQRLQNTGQAYENQLKLQTWEIRDLMKAPNLAKLLEETSYIKAKKMVIPAQIDQLHASTRNLLASAEFTNLNTHQKSMMEQDIHKLLINQVDVENGRKSLIESQKEAVDIQNSWEKSGMSKNFAERIITTVLGGALRK